MVAEIMIETHPEEYFEIWEKNSGSVTLLRNNKRKALELKVIEAIEKEMKSMTEDQLEEFYSEFEGGFLESLIRVGAW